MARWTGQPPPKSCSLFVDAQDGGTACWAHSLFWRQPGDLFLSFPKLGSACLHQNPSHKEPGEDFMGIFTVTLRPGCVPGCGSQTCAFPVSSHTARAPGWGFGWARTRPSRLHQTAGPGHSMLMCVYRHVCECSVRGGHNCLQRCWINRHK